MKTYGQTGYKKVYIPDNPVQTGCRVKVCPQCKCPQEYTAATILCDKCISEPDGHINELFIHSTARDLTMDYYERGCDGEL